MKFEHPDVFYALAALAVPILVHLFNFRRYKQVVFTNVQFLKEVQEQHASRTNIKERVILLFRLLSLIFIILAFAKPYLVNQNAASVNSSETVSIFVDNSYSMQALNKNGSLLDEAKRSAKEIVSAYGPNTRFQLLTQEFEGKQQRLLTAEEFNSRVDTVKFSALSRTLQQIIDRQQSFLLPMPQAVKKSFIISDYQHNIADRKLTISNRLHVSFVYIKAAELPNIAIDSLSMLSATRRVGSTEKLLVKLHNYADKDALATPLKLSVNGVQKALGSASIKANASYTDTLEFSDLKSGWQQAELQLQDNPITFDNHFYFAFNVAKQVSVLLINGGKSAPYITAAFKTDPFFKLDDVNVNAINYSSLSYYPAIILTNVKMITAGLMQQLAAYVNNGGTLIVFPAEDADIATYKKLLQPLNTAWPQKLVTERIKAGTINSNHPVFTGVFEKLPQKPDLPLVNKYYELTGNISNPANHIIDLANTEMLLGGYHSGKGKIYISAVPLNEEYSNLPRHALFVPLLFRMTLTAMHDAPLYYYVSNNEYMLIPNLKLSGNQQLLLKGNNQSFVCAQQRHGESDNLFIADQVKQAGLYRLTANDSLIANVAFNNNRSESDLHYLTQQQLMHLVPPGSKLISVTNQPLKPVLTESNYGVQLWKVCLILALIFVAAEIMLLRNFKSFSIR